MPARARSSDSHVHITNPCILKAEVGGLSSVIVPHIPSQASSVAFAHRQNVPHCSSFVFRENRVPFYQRLFQNNSDGKRQWWKTERSGYVMYPYLISVYGMGIATTYAMCRMVFGHKTWFGKD
ncbi:hypothetical protein BO70DRAFT_427656 [Aspergillus heteromorphus CBS 117.55]|uniref:Uncharacterized protein n=1 Tax=Aspergillus heteromorphus CBS 117.55 TaxID=1448321 RepID=A0A317WP38_9EURO|nr:uncharacterized protein BO70DRAFT_427656 [Aspergillus heteromorphus CBS 117.55]PWY87755.1 hypothetical protein BO70DRAFT_427656 [Aspergillus heteromorphus CBS 117.55]